MREMFPENFTQNEAYFDQLWKKSIIVFDTNVLMDLHAWPKEQFEWLINSIEPIANKFWIPNQVAREFTRNRILRLKDRQKKINDEIRNVRASSQEVGSKIIGQLSNARADFDFKSFPDIDSQIQEWLNPIIAKLEEERDELKKRETLEDDYAFDMIEKVFANKIGNPFSLQEEMKVYEEGKIRYAGLIPPGFGDVKDKLESHKLYGDLIIWKQIIKYASNINCPGIILVTNDKKSDWFEDKRDPHKELLREFRISTHGKPFWIYSFPDFLNNAEKQNVFLSLERYSEVIREAERDDSDRKEELRLAREYGIEKIRRQLALRRSYQDLEDINKRIQAQDFLASMPSFQLDTNRLHSFARQIDVSSLFSEMIKTLTASPAYSSLDIVSALLGASSDSRTVDAPSVEEQLPTPPESPEQEE